MVKTFSFKGWVDLTLKSGIMLFTSDHHCKERITGLKKSIKDIIANTFTSRLLDVYYLLKN